jgi:hypothetical protein
MNWLGQTGWMSPNLATYPGYRFPAGAVHFPSRVLPPFVITGPAPMIHDLETGEEGNFSALSAWLAQMAWWLCNHTDMISVAPYSHARGC